MAMRVAVEVDGCIGQIEKMFIWAFAAELLIASNEVTSKPCDAKSSFFNKQQAN